jgi:hypothetical protein
LASYLYESSELLFYNPAVWEGLRYHSIHDDRVVRAAGEPLLMRQYMEEHEPVVRALKIYLLVARLYPQTRAARDALYTAAVCHIRLSGYNPYWRTAYDNGLYAGARMVTLADVRAAYPAYQFPRGTYGWQPSTRTVNGGAGWAARPRPQPRPTWRARLKHGLESIVLRVAAFWEQTGRRWLAIWLSCIGLLCASHIAARARGLLRQSTARRDRNRAIPDGTVGIFSADQFGDSVCWSSSRWRTAVRDRIIEMWQLRFSSHGRSVLALNVITHTLLAGLLLALIRALRSG